MAGRVMKRLLQVAAGLVVLVVVVAVGLMIWLATAFPKVAPASDRKAATSDAAIARGDYLFNKLCACAACHSQRDHLRLAGPLWPGTLGQGGEVFDRKDGMPGTIPAPNLTPTALADWSDGEIARAIASGVSKDGRALFPIMPYQHYAKLATADVDALVVYLRTLAPITNPVAARHLDFPMNLIVNTIPADPVGQPATPPAVADPAYGAYVINAAACLHCHSPSHHGEPIKGQEFSGGVTFPMPGAIVASANLTPDAETGIGKWSRADFIKRFKHGPEATPPPRDANSYDSPMPWSFYAAMDEADLGAIYDYLHGLPAVSHAVVKVTPIKP
jgi:mono/diheme cytochrome c family protein